MKPEEQKKIPLQNNTLKSETKSSEEWSIRI
jgi:hypothetical protein